MYYSDAELLEWFKNPSVNPVTGYKLTCKEFNVKNRKSTMANQFKKQWEVYQEMQTPEILEKCRQLPTDIIREIGRKKFQDNEERLQRIMDFHWMDRQSRQEQSQKRHSLSITDTTFVSHYSKNDAPRHKSFINSEYVLSNKMQYATSPHGFSFQNEDILIGMHQSIDKHHIFNFTYDGSRCPDYCIQKDYLYSEKYKIAGTFWKNIAPIVSVYIEVFQNGHVKMKSSLETNHKTTLHSKIPFPDLIEDMQRDENHPFLKAYREGLRICFRSIRHILHLKIDEIPIFEHQKAMQRCYVEKLCFERDRHERLEHLEHLDRHDLYLLYRWLSGQVIFGSILKKEEILESYEKINDKNCQSCHHCSHCKIQSFYDVLSLIDDAVNNKKDISSWEVPVGSHGYLALKFCKNETNTFDGYFIDDDLHKKRIQSLISADSWKMIV